jgi:hypothetical protein
MCDIDSISLESIYGDKCCSHRHELKEHQSPLYHEVTETTEVNFPPLAKKKITIDVLHEKMINYEDNNDGIEAEAIHVLPELVSDDSDVESTSMSDVDSISLESICGSKCCTHRHKLKECQSPLYPEVTETTEVDLPHSTKNFL